MEATVVHNFLWHERYTWVSRVRPSWRKSLPRLLRFNLTNGAVSIGGNLALMKVMVAFAHVNYLAGNAIAIAACSMVNFLVSEVYVFEKNTRSHLINTPKVDSTVPSGAKARVLIGAGRHD